MKRSVKLLRQIGILLVGVPIIIFGIILIPLPGPGLLVIILGLVVLSLEFEIAREYRDKARAQMKKVIDQTKNMQSGSGKQIQYIAFYGTLTKSGPAKIHKKIDKYLEFESKCQIPGRLVDLGRLKGLKKGKGSVEGELYKIKNTSVLKILDEFESVIDDKPGAPAYTRKLTKLIKPKLDAWVYLYDG